MLLFLFDPDAGLRRADAGTVNRLKRHFKPGEIEQRELRLQFARFDPGGDERAENHVAARPGITVEIESLHISTKAGGDGSRAHRRSVK